MGPGVTFYSKMCKTVHKTKRLCLGKGLSNGVPLANRKAYRAGQKHGCLVFHYRPISPKPQQPVSTCLLGEALWLSYTNNARIVYIEPCSREGVMFCFGDIRWTVYNIVHTNEAKCKARQKQLNCTARVLQWKLLPLVVFKGRAFFPTGNIGNSRDTRSKAENPHTEIQHWCAGMKWTK